MSRYKDNEDQSTTSGSGMTEEEADAMEDRCQPIGCDNGYHLQGCRYLWRDMTAEQLACLFHETSIRLGPDYGFRVLDTAPHAWIDVSEKNKRLLTAVAAHILATLRDV